MCIYREPRGYALKFQTEDGIWDLLGLHTPVFFIRDPILYPSLIHCQKKNPVTNLKVRISKCIQEVGTYRGITLTAMMMYKRTPPVSHDVRKCRYSSCNLFQSVG